MSNKPLRLGLLAYAILLFAAAGWVLLGESDRFNSESPQRDNATPLAADSPWTGRAASLTVIRGDLWALRALSITPFTGTEISRRFLVTNTKQLEGAREAAERAVSYSPYDAKMWLLLAQLSTEGTKGNSAELLKMAYYTAPTDPELIPLRLALSLKPPAFDDPDIRELIHQDLRAISRAQMQSTLSVIYREASSDGKAFVESALQEIDPALLARLRS